MERETSGEVAAKTEGGSNDLSFREALEKNMAEDKGPEAKATEPEVKEAPKPEQKAAEPATEQKQAPEREVIPPVLAPADMTNEEKEIFSKADPKLQSYLSRRAYEIRSTLSREAQKIQEKAKNYEGLERVIEPNREYLAMKKLSPQAVVESAIAWERAFERDKLGAAKEYLAAQGVDLYELMEGEGEQRPTQQQKQIDPEAIKQEIWNEINQKFQVEQEARSTEANLSAVERFKSSKILFKDPNTAAQLEADLAPIVESLARQNPGAKAEVVLETAYNYVTKGNDTYSRLLESYGQREKAEAAREAAEKAKQSSKSITGGLAGSNPSTKGLDFREELRLRMQGGM